jgi:hypothetical protein
MGETVMSSLRYSGGIFISYRREETAANAGRLYDHLTDRFGRDHVFMDIDSIAIGIDFTKAVIEAVSGCNILLALIGRSWLAITDSKGSRRIENPDDWVRIEIETALQRDIRVIPVLVDGAVLPQADNLPPSLRPLVKRQTFELSHTGFRSQVMRLIEAVDEALGAEPGRTGQGRWQLELLAGAYKDTTFRLWSGTEVHEIVIRLPPWKDDVIEVDGKLAVKQHDIGGEDFPLVALSSSIGFRVTVRVTGTRYSWHYGKVNSVRLQIGDETLWHERPPID